MTPTTWLSVFLCTTACSTLACTDREVARVEPRQNVEQEKEIPTERTRNIDILFVIDNSGSMEDEQIYLADNFDNFINVLSNIDGGLPDIHIGVVSTDLGAGPYSYRNCSGTGDSGILQSTAVGETNCTAPDGRYIVDTSDGQGGRIRNYTGNLKETFSCIAQLGIDGCGFEQPLESMYRALNGSNSQNDGFLREDAYLAVIVITDEDDCSVEDLEMFNNDRGLEDINSSLGFASFRCFEFGVECDPDEPRAAGQRQDCVAREPSPYLHSVRKYTDFLAGLKDDPGDVIVAGIRGPGNNVNVVHDEGKPRIGPSCCRNPNEVCDVDTEEKAAPAVRLDTFLESFPNRNTATSICNQDFSDALTVIATLLKDIIGTPCMDGDLILEDGLPSCTVSDVINLNQDGQTEEIMPACNEPLSTIPCYRFEVDIEHCSDKPTQLALIIERGDTEPARSSTVVARCVGK